MIGSTTTQGLNGVVAVELGAAGVFIAELKPYTITGSLTDLMIIFVFSIPSERMPAAPPCTAACANSVTPSGVLKGGVSFRLARDDQSIF